MCHKKIINIILNWVCQVFWGGGQAAQGGGQDTPRYLAPGWQTAQGGQDELLHQFQFNSSEMFLWWPSTKVVQAMIIC